MTEHLSPGAPPVVLFCTRGPYPAAVLTALMRRGVLPRVLVVPGSAGGGRGLLPVWVRGGPPDAAELAASAGIPVVGLDPGQEQRVAERLHAETPALGLVACFPRRIPPLLYSLPEGGTWNLHPSLLPRYRGPAPVFWQLRAGEQRTGVSLHRLADRLDAGPVAAQLRVPFPPGASADELDRLLGEAAACLAMTWLGDLSQGRASLREQDEAEASYEGLPEPGDLSLDTGWPAQQAYAFMRGAEGWGAFPVATAAGPFVLSRALAFRPGGRLAGPVLARGREVQIQFSPGILRAQAA